MTTRKIVFLSLFLVLLVLLPSGIAYAWTPLGSEGAQNLQLSLTSITEISGPTYMRFSITSSLPTSMASLTAGPFAPGDSLVISYTVTNEGNLPVSTLSPRIIVNPDGSGFIATIGQVPSTLGPGKSFTSTLTITLQASVGNSYQGSSALITLVISGYYSCHNSHRENPLFLGFDHSSCHHGDDVIIS